MTTYGDLSDEAKGNLTTILDIYESKEFDIPNLHDYSCYGLCSDCNYLITAESEFKILIAKCAELEIKLTSAQPIIKCTKYNKRGQMSLWDMKDIAILIDDKEKIGF